MHPEEPIVNPFVESLNYLQLVAQDHINTLPNASKIAVAAQAQHSINVLKELIENYPKLENELQRALNRQKKRENEVVTDSE